MGIFFFLIGCHNKTQNPERDFLNAVGTTYDALVLEGGDWSDTSCLKGGLAKQKMRYKVSPSSMQISSSRNGSTLQAP